ncbi:MAG: DUF3604 domain-containing protein [Chlamydiales bacterium]|nr:DUF3604 domain-containing protein [Chlamydiia bacterium]MCP5508243.1 DUF3604 domain-containing protein [Chlamydiales bacterium]
MRRSICYCEPSAALAGEVNTWKFVYTPSIDLPEGTMLRFDLVSEGRPIDWQIPDTNLKSSGNVIYGLLENGKTVKAEEVEVDTSYTPIYEFELPEEVEAGSTFTIVVGAPKGKKTSEKTGTTAQCCSQRRKPFLLSVDTVGKGHFDEPEVFHMDIRGSSLHDIKVMVPSFVTKNKRFDVVIRFEDEYGNLTSNAPEDTLIELFYENIRENLNWKLFVPETGFITLPNLYFNEPGVYTINLRNAATGDIYKASPIRCFSEDAENLLWGVFHGESERLDSMENIEGCLRHFRDEKGLNFFACSPFESAEETPQEIWKTIVQNILEFDEADRYITLIGFQWVGSEGSEGIRNMVYTKDHKQILRKKEPKNSSLKKIYKSFSPKELVSIPSFTMAKGYQYNFNDFNPEFERVVEIYNAWGSSECTAKEGNTMPIKTSDKIGVNETVEGAVLSALKRNLRFGFVAGGLDDRGIYSDFYDSEQMQYNPGLTAVICPEYTRSSIADALQRRSCYATTGERIIVGMNIAGTPIGAEVTTAEKPGLNVNRHIEGYVAGTDEIKTIEIIRNGEVIETIKPQNTYHIDFEYDDMVSLEKVAIKPSDKKSSFVFYYLRITQNDGNMAWSSPIWIDLVEISASEKKAKRAARTYKKSAVTKILEEYELEQEDNSPVVEDIEEDLDDEE